MYDNISEPDGPCVMCGGPAIVSMSEVNFCIEHAAQEMSLSTLDMVKHIKYCGVQVAPKVMEAIRFNEPPQRGLNI